MGLVDSHRLTFSFSQENILEVRWDLLISDFREPKTVALVRGNIGHVFDGSLPHCADTLKLGLRKAFNSKKQRTCVKLRCAHGNCEWYNNPVSYSSVGSNIYCQMCTPRGRGNRYLQCVGCGQTRSADYGSCQGCRKRFI